jgi:plastocyanin
MTRLPVALSLALITALVAACRPAPAPEPSTAAPAAQPGGTIKGHVRLSGTPPENPEIRMRADPMCDAINAGKRMRFQAVVVSTDGSLANVFVKLQGTFPSRGAVAAPVTIDQHGCLYEPRVVGLQVGQALRVQNSDPGLHNVHGTSSAGTADGFNVGQPTAGMISEFKPKNEGILKLQCDVHGWMVAFVGVVNHPYFGVSSETGTFEIRDVPPGTYPIEAWHEQYGRLTQNVTVQPNAVVEVEFVYETQSKEKGTE